MEAGASSEKESLKNLLSDKEETTHIKCPTILQKRPSHKKLTPPPAEDTPSSHKLKRKKKKAHTVSANNSQQLPEKKSPVGQQEKLEKVTLLGASVLEKAEEEVLSNAPNGKSTQNSLPTKKKKKRKKKLQHAQLQYEMQINENKESIEEMLAITPAIHLPHEPIDQLIIKVESHIQQVLEEKRADPLRVYVPLPRQSDIPDFYKAFHELIKKYPFPFNWGSINKGPIDKTKSDSPWHLELQLSSQARFREQVEKEFVYQVSSQEKEMVDWELIYRLVMKSGFSLEDFKFNNALRVRVLELQGNNEKECVEEIKHFLDNKLSKDINPFHIIALKINKPSGLKAGQLLQIYFHHISPYRKDISRRGTIYNDDEADYLYLCLDNESRKILDLHGKKHQTTGRYEGRNAHQGREETVNFIVQAYEDFQEEVTILTGRGNHINSNGQKGVLNAAFKEKWMKEARLVPILKKCFPVTGGGGYKVKLIKPKKLDLTVVNFSETVPLVKQTIFEMVQNKQARLLLSLDFKGNPLIRNPEFELMMHLTQHLMEKEAELFKNIYPLSFEAESGKLRIIFNKVHPRAPHSLRFGNYFGISLVEGNMGNLPD